jgi:hypothetical protein
MSLVDLADRVAEQHLLRLGHCNAVFQLRFAPVRLVPLEALQPSYDELHATRLAASVYMINMYET